MPCAPRSTLNPKASPTCSLCRPRCCAASSARRSGDLPDWARPLTFGDYFGIRHRRFRDQLGEMLRDAEDRVKINRGIGELTISFGGDTNQATQFARSVPDFALKGRFADMVKLDLRALEQEMGFAVGPSPGWWRRLVRR